MSKPTITSKIPKIIATSQQSRFHSETLDTTTEVDLKGVNISIGDRELISDSKLRFKAGIRYALVGRNGTGKSTLLEALAEKLIPGLGKALRIVLVSQVTDTIRIVGHDGEMSVLKHVIHGDVEREKAIHEFNLLTKAVDSSSVAETQHIVSEITLARLVAELADARKVASRTSGARGKKARDEEIKAEARVKKAEQDLAQNVQEDTDVVRRAADMLAEVSTSLEILDASTAEPRAASILVGLGFSTEMINGPVKALSGGWRSRCALATSLLVQSDVLLLDEPSNFLDLEATLWLEQYLINQERTLVVTSHDQVFLNSVVEETILLRDKTLRYFEGTPRAYELDEKKKRKTAIKSQNALDKRKEHIERSIQQGRAAAKQSGDDNKLRMAKSRQKKLDERWGTEVSAKGTRFKLNRDLAGYHLSNRAEIEIDEGEPPVRIVLPSPDKLRTIGDLIHFDNVSFSYRRQGAKLEGVTLTVGQGGRCAFVGANGQGKSTLAKLIMGEVSPSKGVIVRHPSLKIGYFTQHSVEELSNESLKTTTALKYFLDHFDKFGDPVQDPEARACLGTLGLSGKVASDTPLAALSGGQKVRLAIALIIFRPPTLLLLDEITTHVDAPTIRALAIALKKFTGAIVLMTHDRWFSRAVVEGCSISSAQAFGDDEGDGTDISDESDEGNEDGQTGKTYMVSGGKVKLLENGMSQYVALVERKLERRKRAAAAEAAKKKGEGP
ncbi:P-loop containing nucleoside triphosphate hydrolase protein [Pleurotus eryngii]|uniref:P-loop containing nucleoside triphosphate hydrolase protein n=1 Tax=Pleurotus eryngii TaxID=5323 RepID=A0A9P6DDZ2_PLEER|nr:P-loop containing nucleoside triphosphate hydrolase protein [Pleurotus eryngii]